MKYLPREVAFEKMKVMVEGAKLMRSELRPRVREDLRGSQPRLR